MNSSLRNIIAVVVGVVLGMTANMGLIMLSGHIIPPPEGVDPSNMDSLAANIDLFEPKHFIFPFLAHALGTLVGAMVTTKIAPTHNLYIALVIGLTFLIGGVMMAMDLPSPLWFNILDLILAYIPMAWLGWKIVK